MQRTLITLALTASLAIAGAAAAQDFVFGWNPRSGDVWIDNTLGDINQYGYRYREPFIDEMTRYYDAPRDLVSDLLINRRWAPGDIYYACALAQVIGRPCRYVAEQWEQDHGQGWGALAKRLGIKPGSPEFHRLKRGFVPSYDRWGRPIRIDDSLRMDFPDRGQQRHAFDARDHDDGDRGHGNSGKAGQQHGNSGNGNSGNSDKGNSGNSGKGKSKAGHSGGDNGHGNAGGKDKGKGQGKH